MRDLPPVNIATLRKKRVFLSQRVGCSNRKTVIFDLDETLVHCAETRTGRPDALISIRQPDRTIANLRINIRPYARECLEAASRDFEVVVFTASEKTYADAILDHLDPHSRFIHHRLYRENCI